nr:hypothetical protein [uncultured Allomuricauda sp.]
MARVNRMQSGTQNPAKYFFQWKSDHQKFCYYDKEKKENVFVDLPFKFLALSRYITVKGWNQKKEHALISNEVKSIDDVLVVNAYKDGSKSEVVRGKWNEIKEKMEVEKGKFTQSVYVMLPNGEVANIQLNGASLSTWFEFQNNQTDRFFDNWVLVNGYKDGKSGTVEYTYPVFEWGTSLDTESQLRAENADAKIEEYEESYFGKSEEPKENYRERSEVDKHEMNQNKPPVPPSEVDAELAMHDAVANGDDDLPF